MPPSGGAAPQGDHGGHGHGRKRRHGRDRAPRARRAPPPETAWRRIRREGGERGETAALAELGRRGYRVLARNLRSRLGEIDLVCRDGEAVVFCEVKARRPSLFGRAEEALTDAKRARLVRLAEAHMAREELRHLPFRVELVAVTLDAAGQPRHVEVLPLG